jgi:outer membrane immunogenic protein
MVPQHQAQSALNCDFLHGVIQTSQASAAVRFMMIGGWTGRSSAGGSVMKTHSVITLAAFTTLLASQAIAADLPAKAPVYKAPPPVIGWSGFYVGANAGYGWANSDVGFAGDNFVGAFLVNPGTVFAGATPLGPASFRSQGLSAGLQAGYNWQVSPAWLVGFETDINWSRIDGDGQSGNLLAPGVPLFQTMIVDRKISSYGTVRARLGWLPTPNVLLYGTGGFAYGRIRESVTEVLTSPAFPAGTPVTITGGGTSLACVLNAPCLTGNSSRIATGWAAGFGSEFAVSPNVSVKGEYLYLNLGGDSFHAVAPATTVGSPIPASVTASYNHVNLHTVRIGINYRFGGPLVAAY